MRNFRDLTIWRDAILFAKEIYLLTSDFPDRERYGMISQMRRCSVSISSNIAEGCSRNTNKHLIYFLEISLGSAFEIETQLIIALEIGFLDVDKSIKIFQKLTQLQKSINAFRTVLRKKEEK